MRILTDAEFNSGPFPTTMAAKTWREDAVTERMFNILWRLVPAAGSAEFRDGFRTCKDLFLDRLNAPETFVVEPQRAPDLPEPDYGSEAYLRLRRSELNLSTPTPTPS